MSMIYKGEISISPFNVKYAEPADVRTVVKYVDDLKGDLLSLSYEGMVVYVVEDSSLYVCYNLPDPPELDNVEDGWRRLDVDYSVRIVESESNLTDGTTILFPYRGMMAYVTSESSLYILTTKGVENAKDINNWKKISAASSTSPAIDKVGIDVAPEGGYGFKITGNSGVIVDDYVNAENYIKASYSYTSNGVNSYEPNPFFDFETVRLSKEGGDAYIELYANGDNWMMINDPENTLGLSVTIDGKEYVSGELVKKGAQVCFGVDVKFHEGWTIAFGGTSRKFAERDYEFIDIYRSGNSPEVYAYYKDIDVRMLTEDDLADISNSIMIDLDGDSDGSDSDFESQPLQNVIVNMNNAITKLEKTVEKVEAETIEHSDIEEMFK